MLSDLAVKQFIEIYKIEFGIALPEEQAKIKALKIFSFFKTIVQEISKEQKLDNFSQKGGVNKTIYDHENKSNQI